MVQWEKLTNWLTANQDVYQVQHYGVPKMNLPTGSSRWAAWEEARGAYAGRHQSAPTQEHPGDHRMFGQQQQPRLHGRHRKRAVDGHSLAALLKECEPLKRGIEVAFLSTDTAKDELRKNEYTAHFSRGLHITDAMRDDILLCYEMNGEPLPVSHGAPLRLVVPGWFGIAWVKWLSRIEVLDRRIMSKYMAREYVTLREEERGETKLWRETSIGPMLVKSIAARALRLADGTIRIHGAAWGDGTPLRQVEMKIDAGPWQPVVLDKKNRSKYCWTFWTYDWTKPEPGEHTIVSRATDAEGRSQPPADAPVIKLKKTYWEANQQWPRRINVPA
jgi:DMSO/TMAO reductase YedYZ molybdopterin-dependent catalytic subunit